MSDDTPISIKTLAGEFEKKELQQFTNKQYIALQSAQKRIKQLEGEIEHLQKLLADAVPIVGEQRVAKLIAPNEQEVCEIQIRMIKERALNNELTFEDAKKLETYVRTMKTIKERDGMTKEPPKTFDMSKVSDAQLIETAKQSDKEDE